MLVHYCTRHCERREQRTLTTKLMIWAMHLTRTERPRIWGMSFWRCVIIVELFSALSQVTARTRFWMPYSMRHFASLFARYTPVWALSSLRIGSVSGARRIGYKHWDTHLMKSKMMCSMRPSRSQ